MSLLFCSASSMARFRVRATAEGLVCASCACADAGTATKKNNAMVNAIRKEPGFELKHDLLFMLVSSSGLWPQKAAASRCPKLFVAQGLNWLQACGLVRR